MMNPASSPSTSATVVSATRFGDRWWKASSVRLSVSPSGTWPGWERCHPACQISATPAASSGVAARRVTVMTGAYDRHMTVPPALGWVVLGLVFLDEVLVMVALGVWGHHAGGWLLSVGAVLAGVLVWSLVASPKARYGGPVARPVAKVLVIGS